jgi:hypothetical protein
MMIIPPKCDKCGTYLDRYNATDNRAGLMFYISACPKCFEITSCRPTGCLFIDDKNKKYLKFMQGFWKKETGEECGRKESGRDAGKRKKRKRRAEEAN